jgi:hypothetical protein
MPQRPSILLLATEMLLIGAASTHAGAAAAAGLPRTPTFLKALAELFPEYNLPKQEQLAPKRAGLPQVGIVAALEKAWRRQTIMAVQVVRFQQGYGEVKGCSDTAVAVVRGAGQNLELVAKSGFFPGQPGKEGAPVENFQECRKLTESDTADFRISEQETAFGLRFRYDDVTKTGASYRETLVLYRIVSSAVRPILTTESETCDCATSGYEGCGKLQRSTARCQPADGSDYRKVYLKILPSKSRGMNEIARLEERVPGEKPRTAGVFRWDGKQYQLGPEAPPSPCRRKRDVGTRWNGGRSVCQQPAPVERRQEDQPWGQPV